VLEVCVANLIESRRRLKELFSENLFSANADEEAKPTNDLDNSFLEKFRNLVEQNLADSKLNVEDLGQQIGLSRTQLYRKLKSLTGYSPKVGFTAPSYFAKCFKDYYNESPTDFLKKVR
jgi:AraC-like DNA-binding protein